MRLIGIVVASQMPVGAAGDGAGIDVARVWSDDGLDDTQAVTAAVVIVAGVAQEMDHLCFQQIGSAG